MSGRFGPVRYGKRDGVDYKKGAAWKQLRYRHDGSSDEIFELESHLVIRLPEDLAAKVREAEEASGETEKLKPRLSIQFQPPPSGPLRDAIVLVDGEKLYGRLKELPCILETQKTLDRKTFYKSGDVSQLLVCRREVWEEGEEETGTDGARKTEKAHLWPHGLTPPLKNVRKRRFRKTLKKKYMDAPELEAELKRVLREDLEADEVHYELVSDADDAQRRADGRASVPGPAAVSATPKAPVPVSASARPREFCFDPDESTASLPPPSADEAPVPSAPSPASRPAIAQPSASSQDDDMDAIMASAGVLPPTHPGN